MGKRKLKLLKWHLSYSGANGKPEARGESA